MAKAFAFCLIGCFAVFVLFNWTIIVKSFVGCNGAAEIFLPDVPQNSKDEVVNIIKIELNKNVNFEFENVCHIMHVFTQKEIKEHAPKGDKHENAMVIMLGIGEDQSVNSTTASFFIVVVMVVLAASVMKSGHEAWMVKRQVGDSRNNRRKVSLIEFANAKQERRESHIAQMGTRMSRRDSTVFVHKIPSVCRMDSANSYLTLLNKGRKDSTCGVGPVISENDSPGHDSIIKTPLKLLGARPVLMRRSSFPVAPHALEKCAGKDDRRMSIDSEDDSSPDVGRRRVRIIRRH